MDEYMEKMAAADEAGRMLAKIASKGAIAKKVLGGAAVGTGLVGAGAAGHEIGEHRTKKRMAKYPKMLARLASMASKPGGIRMVARPRYYRDAKGNVRRAVGVQVTS